jgi:site-specific DNA-methyltransferase (adenine-specific)
MLKQGDCRTLLKELPENSVDSVVTDPPYELSNDGKASASRVFLEMMFPQNANIKTELSGEDYLSFLVQKVLCLSGITGFPTPATTVPISSMTFNGKSPLGNKDVEHASISAVGVSDGETSVDIGPEGTEYLGCFMFKLANTTAALQALNSIGTGFDAGGIGVGFGITTTSYPGFLHSLTSVDIGDHNIGSFNNAFSQLISTFGRAEYLSVPRFSAGGGTVEHFSTYGALVLLALLKQTGSQVVRTLAGTRRLPAMFEPRHICVVDDITNRAVSFDIIVHNQYLASTGFMSKGWDGSKIAYDVLMWAEVLRVLKPGGHMLAFGGTRTHHRMTCAIEDAGFEIRDELDWIYASGFPKSLNVSKVIDKQAGHTRASSSVPNMKNKVYGKGMGGGEWNAPSEPAVTDAAKQWEGWGTALKPAREPIVLARKPMSVSIAKNIQEHGTGAINIDATRIGGNPGYKYAADRNGTTFHGEQGERIKQTAEKKGSEFIESSKGRWPANVLLSHSPDCVCVGSHVEPGYVINRWDDGSKPFGDGAGHPFTSEQQPDEVIEEWRCTPDCPVRQLNEQSGDRPGFVSNGNATVGETSDGVTPFRRGTGGIWHEGNGIPCGPQYSDNGGAARFFYVAKPSRAEREAGCEHLPVKTTPETVGRDPNSAGVRSPRAGAGRGAGTPLLRCTVCGCDGGGGRYVSQCVDGGSHRFEAATYVMKPDTPPEIVAQIQALLGQTL